MQNAELFRRGVVLPLDDDPQAALERNDVDEGTKIHYLEIEDQQSLIGSGAPTCSPPSTKEQGP